MAEMNKITSRENRRLIEIRRVRDGKSSDRIFIEGSRLADEALRSELSIVEGVVSSSFLEHNRSENIINELERRRVPIIETPDRLFSSLADTVNPQGVILIAQRPLTGRERLPVDNLSLNQSLFVFLSETNDPSNLGAVLRTAEAVGVAGVIISVGSADAFSPKALRAGMGSTFRIPFWDHVTLTESVDWAREKGIQIIAADISGKRSHWEIDWRRPTLAVFGSEANGLTDEDMRLADEIVAVPMQNGVESLNLAVSAGVILFEAMRQKVA